MSNENGKPNSAGSRPGEGAKTQVREGVVKGNTLPTYQAPPPPPPKVKK